MSWRLRFPRVALGALAVALVAGACASQTIIGEGELAGPIDVVPTPTTVEDDGDELPADDADEPPASSAPDEDDADRDPPAAADFQIVDEALVAELLAECEDGSDLSCDLLFTASEPGSDEEAVALSCAGRPSSDPLFCTAGLEAETGELSFDPSSPAVPDIIDACTRGDMTACDVLFFRSPVDSEAEEVGRGCGGRVTVALPDCRTLFPDED